MAGFLASTATATLLRPGDADGIGYATVANSAPFTVGATVSLASGDVANQYQVAEVLPGRVGLRALYEGTPARNAVNFGLSSVAAFPVGAILTQPNQFLYSTLQQSSTLVFSLLTTTVGQIATGSLFTNQGTAVTFTRAGAKFGSTGIAQDPAQLVPNPEVFDASSWTLNQCTMTPAAVAPPPGAEGTPVYAFADDTQNLSHFANPPTDIIQTNSVPYTGGLYVKAGSAHFITLNFDQAPPGAATFNLSQGTVPYTFNGAVGTITAVGNDWWKITIEGTESALPDTINIVANAPGLSTYSPAYVGTGSYVYICALKVEQTSSATAYQFTGGRNNAAFVSIGNNLPVVEAAGLLIEPAITNRVASDISHSNWAIQGVPVITANAAVAPDGTLTATLLTTDNSGTNRIYTTTGGTGDFTPSMWIKRISASGTLNVCNAGGPLHGNMDIDLALLGSDWTRVYPGHPATSNLTTWDDGSMLIQGGSGQVSAYFWEVQLEPGLVMHSNVHNSGSGVTTCPADVATLPTTDFPTLSGRWCFDFTPEWNTAPPAQIRFLDTGDLGITMIVAANAAMVVYTIDSGGVDAISSFALSWTAGQTYKFELVYGNGSMSMRRDGVVVASGAVTHLPDSFGTLVVGAHNYGGNFAEQAEGWFSNIRIYSR